jgi:hypothetical protein
MFAFSVVVVDEFAFCPVGLPAILVESKQKAEAARTNAKMKLLKRTTFKLIIEPSCSIGASLLARIIRQKFHGG